MSNRPYFCYVNSEYTGNDNIGVLDLTKPPFIGEISNDLLAFKWTPITQGQAVQKIVKFEKNMIEKKFKILISGESERDYFYNLERFLQITDVDINNLKTGRLYIGDYFLDCYIVANGKPKKYLGTNKTLLQLTAVCERGNWQKEESKSFYGGISHDDDMYTANGFVYEVDSVTHKILGYDYAVDGLTHKVLGYDYASPYNMGAFINESYMDADFELVFYGAMQRPKIIIGGNTYEFLDISLAEGEKIVVNSKNKTAILIRVNGNTENIFKNRNREYKIYEKIKGGYNTVIMDVDEEANKEPKVDLTLFYERSEPKWIAENVVTNS